MSRGANAIKHHLFTLITLLGCLAPWITPRHFPLSSFPGRALEVAGPPRIQHQVLESVERDEEQPLVGQMAGSVGCADSPEIPVRVNLRGK